MTAAVPDDRLRQSAVELLRHGGRTLSAKLAAQLADHQPEDVILAGVTIPAAIPSARRIVQHAMLGDQQRQEAVVFLHGLIDGFGVGYDLRGGPVLIWGGPTPAGRKTLRTSDTLLGLIDGARISLTLMTYSAAPHKPIVNALIRAAQRGVTIRIVVETLAGASGAITGREPAIAFLTVPGAELWHWPTARRHTAKAKQHAKLAVADREVLLITSANLTAAGVDDNLEAGILCHDPVLAGRCLDHIDALIEARTLDRISMCLP